MQQCYFILIVLCIIPIHANAITEKNDKMQVFVSILPMAYFVEQIGGERVNVQVLVGPGQSPETFEPTSKQLVQLARSRAFFTIGVPFEAAILTRIRNNFDDVKIINTSTGIKLEQSTGHHEIDPHIWLDPNFAVKIAGNVCIGLAQMDPDNKNEYETSAAALIKALKAIEGEIRGMLAPFAGRIFYVFHPAYGYFANAYGLVQVSIEEGGTVPGSKHLAELIDQAKAQKIRAIFIQPQHSNSSAKTIADEIGADIIVLDPLSRDYLTNLKEIALRIKEAIEDE